jgi:hypothetical protein
MKPLLMKSVARRIVDGAMLHLVKMWLEAPVEETDERGNKHRSTRNRYEGRRTPQGAPTTPRTQKITLIGTRLWPGGRRIWNCVCANLCRSGWMSGRPDHVTISRARCLMDEATHEEVFGWVLRQVTRAGLLKGKTIGIDATTLEAKAAMKSIVRRDIAESYAEYLKLRGRLSSGRKHHGTYFAIEIKAMENRIPKLQLCRNRGSAHGFALALAVLLVCKLALSATAIAQL